MDQMCFIIPVVSGMVDEARDFIHEMGNARWADYDRSQRRIGITHEVWYMASLPSGNSLVVFMESTDLARAFSLLAESDDEFDRWFRQRLIDVAGLDISNPPEMDFPELISSYSA